MHQNLSAQGTGFIVFMMAEGGLGQARQRSVFSSRRMSAMLMQDETVVLPEQGME